MDFNDVQTLTNHSETLYKALSCYCLDVSVYTLIQTPDSGSEVTWKFELLKTLIFAPVFTNHEA